MRALAARIARAEASAGRGEPVPSVVVVGTGQTPSGALAAFVSKHPQRPRNHALLVVPAKPVTVSERERFIRRFRDATRQLVAAARSERIADTAKTSLESVPALERPTPKPAAAQPRTRSGSTFHASNKLSRAALAKLAATPTNRD